MYSAPRASWDTIGNGYQSTNAHRWEAVDVNGWTVLNNGLDLPQTYRANDPALEPIYELRELGIAYVGTIAIHAGMLCCMDVSEIQEDKLEELFEWAGIIPCGPTITAYQTVNTVTTNDSFFSASHVGMAIEYADRTRRNITAYISPTQVTVSGDAITHTAAQTFKLIPYAAQAGAIYSDTIKATAANGSTTVAATAAIFTADMVGRWIYFNGGWGRKIASFTSATQVELEEAPDFTISNEYFFIVDDATSYKVTSTTDVFTEDHVGQHIVWLDDGVTREITAFIDAKNVTVSDYVAVSTGCIGVENPLTYAPYLDKQFCNRMQYRFINSDIGEPRRWGAVSSGRMIAESNILRLDYPLKSLEIGHQIVVQGAGVSGGNLTTTIVNSLGLGSILILNTAASTTVTAGVVSRSDVAGSIMGGGYDIYDDGSTILRAQDLRGQLVIYRDTSIFLGRYTGDVTAPFEFKKLSVPEGSTLYYPYTLAEVNGEYHFYAGRRSFWSFDLTTQTPRIVEVADNCKDLFFPRVSNVDRLTKIFAANNHIEQEVWLIFPTTYEDKAICFDYRNGVASTTTGEYTAAAMIKMPNSDDMVDMFVMGTDDGVLLEYGKMDVNWGVWGGDREIFWRRDKRPLDLNPYAYDAILRSGLSDMGSQYNEKRFLSWLLLLSSQEAFMPYVRIWFSLLKARNVSETPTTVLEHLIRNPKSENLLPFLSEAHAFADQIKVSYAAPCRISGRVWNLSVAPTKSITRRENDGL